VAGEFGRLGSLHSDAQTVGVNGQPNCTNLRGTSNHHFLQELSRVGALRQGAPGTWDGLGGPLRHDSNHFGSLGVHSARIVLSSPFSLLSPRYIEGLWIVLAPRTAKSAERHDLAPVEILKSGFDQPMQAGYHYGPVDCSRTASQAEGSRPLPTHHASGQPRWWSNSLFDVFLLTLLQTDVRRTVAKGGEPWNATRIPITS
jgi:hypothetical protein